MKSHVRFILFLLTQVFLIGCSSLGTDKDEPIETRIERVKDIHLACMLYSTKHDMILPDNLVDMKSEIKDEFDFSDINMDKYELLLKGNCRSFSNPAMTIMCREKQPDKNGIFAVVYLDGHTGMTKAPNKSTHSTPHTLGE